MIWPLRVWDEINRGFSGRELAGWTGVFIGLAIYALTSDPESERWRELLWRAWGI